jgi:hypothetical protein
VGQQDDNQVQGFRVRKRNSTGSAEAVRSIATVLVQLGGDIQEGGHIMVMVFPFLHC